MSDTGTPGAGWFHAEGDPPGTQRYWDGAAWVGEPQVVPAAPEAPQAFAAPPPGAPYGSPPMQEPKKSSAWKWVLGIVLGIVLLIGGCSFVVYRLATGQVDAGNEFLAELQAGDIEGAVELTDPSCFGDRGLDDLRETFTGVVIEEYDLNSSNVQFENSEQSGTTSGTITLAGGDERDLTLFMVEKDGWRVCGYEIGPAQ